MTAERMTMRMRDVPGAALDAERIALPDFARSFCRLAFEVIFKRLPAPVDQALHRLELNLVSHLAAEADPVAEIEIRQIESAAEVDLPEYVVSAEARGRHIGIEEGVHG